MNLEFQKEASLSLKRLSEIPPEDMALINSFALKDLSAEEVAVYHLELCNDQVDSQSSVFPREELKAISGMIAGKPLLAAHDRRSLPLGTFFKAWLVEDREKGILSVRASVYMLRITENETLLANLDGGVYRSTSIGFLVGSPICSICRKDIRSCHHVPGHEYDEKKCVVELREVIDVLEGSIVFLGAQRTTFLRPELEKAIKDDLFSGQDIFDTAHGELLNEIKGKNEEEICILATEALEWRKRELDEIIKLGKAVEEDGFDEMMWRGMLGNSTKNMLQKAKTHFQGLFDSRFPPIPISRPLFVNDNEGRKERARRILDGDE